MVSLRNLPLAHKCRLLGRASQICGLRESSPTILAGDDWEHSDHQRLKTDVVAADGEEAAGEPVGNKSKAGELLMPKATDV